jgi:CheY-like chemotaxis protein
MNPNGENNLPLYNSLLHLHRRRTELLSQLGSSISQTNSGDLRALNAEIVHIQSRLDASKSRQPGANLPLMENPLPHSAEASGRRPIAVLLVEDNPGDVALARRMLNGSGKFELLHASRVSSALEQLRDGVAVVLLDLDLPDSCGLDTLRRVREHHPSVPILILSGRDDPKTASEALRAGAQDYLVKGQVSAAVLVQAISRQVNCSD